MMIRTAISGSWKTTSAAVERDVRETVARALDQGDGIVTGGALGVDSVATDEVLHHSFQPEQLRVILPTSLERYASHYRKRASEGVITSLQAEGLIQQLQEVQQRGTLVELDYQQVDQESYFARNTAVLEASDRLAAFQVNGSPGTQDTVDKARQRGMEVELHQYILTP